MCRCAIPPRGCWKIDQVLELAKEKKKERKKEKKRNEKIREKRKGERQTSIKKSEPKTCFGHNKRIKTQNQMKFKGYVCSDEGYKSVSEGH
jgi:hypothetical protein